MAGWMDGWCLSWWCRWPCAKERVNLMLTSFFLFFLAPFNSPKEKANSKTQQSPKGREVSLAAFLSTQQCLPAQPSVVVLCCRLCRGCGWNSRLFSTSCTIQQPQHLRVAGKTKDTFTRRQRRDDDDGYGCGTHWALAMMRHMRRALKCGAAEFWKPGSWWH